MESQKETVCSSTSEDNTVRVTVRLDMPIDARTAAQYLSSVSGFGIEEDIVQVTDVDDDGCTAVLTCPNTSQAEMLISAINSTESETGLNARMLGTPEPTNPVENIWEELCRKAEEQIELHKKKIEEVKARIQDIVSGNKKGKGVEMNEFLRQQALKRPLQEKVRELELQKDEFCGYMDGLQSRLESSAQNQDWHSFATQYRSEFELELERFKRALPMYARKTDALQAIMANQVCIILGETGSGKSTQILQYIHSAGLDEHGSVACTQPRKVAAVSLARYVAREMGNQAGLVGSKVGAQPNRNSAGRLMYITDHLLLNECLKDPLLSKYSVIIVDEAHERSIYSDLLLGFLKLALPKRRDLHVVIMSATINPDLFVSYFSDIPGPGSKPPVLQISGRAFPVDVCYEAAADDYMKAAYLKALSVHRNEPAGDVLVFLTSPIETEKACKNLLSQAGRDAATIQALELHGRLQVEEQQKIFEPTPPGMRKIVFATNTAETSITIPGIKYVIDTGRVKEMSYDAKRNMSSLNVQWVTQSSAQQRKGRAGRTDCGKCYRLYAEADFNEMRQQSVPEILRIHLGQAMLKLMTLGISKPMDFDFVESPSQDAIESAVSVLQDLGACDDNGITELGKKLAKLALEPRLGKVVVVGIERDIPLETAVMAAVSTVGGSIFFRGGTDEQKQLADRKKTRFCDEWGDIVTLVTVYKEWVKIPEKLRNKWCVENSINAKSMRVARDTLADIRQTFKSELNIDIPRDFPEKELANEEMARILFECYYSNLSLFSGHEREGFFLAKLPSSVMFVHPSSALTYLEELPTWVVYEQVLTTNKTYLLNATYVKEAWVAEWISSRKLELQLDYLCLFILKPLPVWYVGSQCIRSLLANKAESKKELETKVRGSSEDAKCFIDIVSLEGHNGGSLTLYSTPYAEALATPLLKTHLLDIRKFLADDYVENLLFPGSRVRLLLERGGQIRTILMPNDSRMVNVKATSSVNLTEATVRKYLSQFGDIERIRTDVSAEGVWGTVTFKLPEHVQKALNVRPTSSSIKLESCAAPTGGRGNSEKFDYTVKVSAARRPLRGFGFVHLQDESDALLASTIGMFSVQKQSGQGMVMETLVKVNLDRKTNTQLYLKNVPMWANETIVKNAVERALERHGMDVNIAKVILPRENVQASMFDEFQRTMKDTLRNWNITDTTDYRANFIAPSEKNFNFIAYFNFNDYFKARTAADLISNTAFNHCLIEAVLLLKISFYMPTAVSKFCANKLQKMIISLNKVTQGAIKDHTKPCKSSVVTTIEATCLDDLVLVRQQLAPLLSGKRVIMSRQQMLFIKSKSGMQQLGVVEGRMRVKLHVDERQSSVLLYADTAVQAEEAETLLFELMDACAPPVSTDISLRSPDYPKGLMKALAVQYGPNLEQLKQETGVDSLDLILRQHKIRIQASEDAHGKILDCIRQTATKLAERCPVSTECRTAASSTALPECPVCFDSVSESAFYVTEYCSHVYCRECAAQLVDNAVRSNQLPVRCCFDKCDEDLVMHDFRNLLDGSLERLCDAAVRVFMMANGDRYSHCITPECPMIYRKAATGERGEEFHCSECKVTVCTACNTAAHPGVLTCVKNHHEIAKWIEEEPENRCACPKCGIGIEKNGGCMHMECTTCHIHFCWRCKKHFATSGQCYGHLSEAHGGY